MKMIEAYLVTPKNYLSKMVIAADRERLSNPVRVTIIRICANGFSWVTDASGNTFPVLPRNLKHFYQLTNRQKESVQN